MGMPEPGGSVVVTGRSFSLLSCSAVICAFMAWWLVFWAAWDRLLNGQIFGNSDIGPASGDVVFVLGLLLAGIAAILIAVRVISRLPFRDKT